MLKKVVSIYLFLVVWAFNATAAKDVPILSDSSRITLLTCTPGEELYSAFGHTAIRIVDDSLRIDVVFNYGTFDFNQPGFYQNFVKGRMRYMLGVDYYNDFYLMYVAEGRGITEQHLNLNIQERQKVFNYLAWNSEKENREYAYDFFWDNCATRPIAVFDTVLGNKIKYEYNNGFEKGKTMHDMLRLYVYDRPWVDFGFDLILGMPCEIEAKPRYQTFLPDYVLVLFDNASVNAEPFVTKKEVVLERQMGTPNQGFQFLPVHVTILLLLIAAGITLLEWKNKNHYWGFDFFIFFLLGLFGVFFICLWAFTDHYSLPKNLNMLWAVPTHFIVSFFLLKKKKPSWLKPYSLFTGAAMVVLLAFWKFSPQPFNYALLPVVLTMAIRSFNMYSFLNKQV